MTNVDFMTLTFELRFVHFSLHLVFVLGFGGGRGGSRGGGRFFYISFAVASAI